MVEHSYRTRVRFLVSTKTGEDQALIDIQVASIDLHAAGSSTRAVALERRVKALGFVKGCQPFDRSRSMSYTFRNQSPVRAIFDAVDLKEGMFTNVSLTGSELTDVNLLGVTITAACAFGVTMNGIDIAALLAIFRSTAG